MKKRILSTLLAPLLAFGIGIGAYGQAGVETWTIDRSDAALSIPRSGIEAVSLPTPETTQLVRTHEHQMDYSTGAMTLRYPLHTYSCGDISLPISISYRTGGVKVDDEAGTAGLGWEFACGGYVSRTVVGLPDDKPGINFDLRVSSVDLEYLKELHASVKEADCDRYHYRAGTSTGSFILRGSRAIALTQTDDAIEKTAGGFRITTPDGTVYEYEPADSLVYSYTPEVFDNTYVLPDYKCRCAWRLARMLSPTRSDTLSFTYESIPAKQKSTSQRTLSVSWKNDDANVRWGRNSESFLRASSKHIYESRSVLSKIEGRAGSIVFSYLRDEGFRDRCSKFDVLNSNGELVRRVELDGSKFLEAYEISDGAGNCIDLAVFDYLRNDNLPPHKDFFGYDNAGIPLTDNPDPPLVLYPRPHEPVTTVSGLCMQIEYEPSLCPAGQYHPEFAIGLRVKADTITDAATGNRRVRSLSYEQPSPTIDFDYLSKDHFITASGALSRPPNGGTPTVYSEGACLTASCRLPGQAPENASIHYGKVTERISGTGLECDAITEYEFDVSRCRRPRCYESNVDNNSVAPGIGEDLKYCGTGIPNWHAPTDSCNAVKMFLGPHVVTGYFKEETGDRAPLKRIAEKRILASGDTVDWKVTSMEYATDTLDIPVGFYCQSVVRTLSGSTVTSNSSFSSVDDFCYFPVYLCKTKRWLVGKTVTERGDNSVLNTVTTRYGYSDRPDSGCSIAPSGEADGVQCSMLTTMRASCGDDAFESRYTYSCSAAGSVYDSMRAARRISAPVRSVFKHGSAQVSISNAYSHFGIPGNPARLSLQTVRNDAAFADIERLEIGGYDRWGNPGWSVRNGDVEQAYAWDEGGTLLRSHTIGNALTTRYEHIPLVGCAKITAPSGFERSFEYDGERLVLAKEGGSPVAAYEYSLTYPCVGGQPHKNSLRSKAITNPATADGPWAESVLDGFGREIASMSAASDNTAATCSSAEYDALGRLTRKSFAIPGLQWSEQEARSFHSDDAPWTSASYASSKDMRPLSATIGGAAFDAHPAATSRNFNTFPVLNRETATTCRRYVPGSSGYGSVRFGGYYPAGTLSVETTQDGDGRRSSVFTDFRGRVILRRTEMVSRIAMPGGSTIATTEYYDTHYVYDDADNLVCVLPPFASKQLSHRGSEWSLANSEHMRGYAYCWRYDDKMRLVESKAPGAEPVLIRYDATGQPFLSQSGNERLRGVFSYSLLDTLGRKVEAGECPASQALADLAAATKVRGTLAEASSSYADNIGMERHPDIVTYYDGYWFLNAPEMAPLRAKLAEFAPGAASAQPKGLATGGKRRLLKASEFGAASADTATQWERFVVCYDSRDRAALILKQNFTGGFDWEETEYSNTGKPLTVRKGHTRLAQGQQRTMEYSYSYDALDRLSEIRLSLDGGQQQRILANEYDAAGRLASSVSGQLQPTVFAYDCRGALSSLSSQHFSQSLSRAGSHAGAVTGSQWTGSDGVSRSYAFEYDSALRLTSASYSESGRGADGLTLVGTPDYSCRYGYDRNSNLTSLHRMGLLDCASCQTGSTLEFGTVDDIALSYDGNRLVSAEDSAEEAAYSSAPDFRDGSHEPCEYAYDENGNVASDANKGIESIVCNSLNLPALVTFDDGSSIENVYDAAGALLMRKKKHLIPRVSLQGNVIGYIASTTTESRYGDYSYESTLTGHALRRIELPNGYVEGGNVRYYARDCQGNVRQVVDGSSGEVLEECHYYPYGSLFGESAAASLSNRRLFGGKELVRDMGFNCYDQEARCYDPVLGRFLSQDPLQSQYFPLSSYLYCAANPVMLSDPTGTDAKISIDGDVVTVNMKIYLYGKDASEKYVKIFQNDLKSTWFEVDKYEFQGITYEIKWNVTIDLMKESDEFIYDGINNYFHVDKSIERSSVTGSNQGKLRITTTRKNTLAEDCPMSHEFGHLLGLEDRYVKNKSGSKSIPKSWSGNIMAEPTYRPNRVVDNRNIGGFLNRPLFFHQMKNNDFTRRLTVMFPFLGHFINHTNYYINKNNREK